MNSHNYTVGSPTINRFPSLTVVGSTGSVEEYNGSVEETALRAAAFGITIGAICDCPLHPNCRGELRSHRHAHREATFWRWHCPRGSWGMAELRAAVAYGRDDLRLSGPQLHRWQERLDWESGVAEVDVTRHQAMVPREVGDYERAVLDCMVLLLALREWHHGYPMRDPFTWARAFATAYVGLSEWRATVGFKGVRRRELILPDGHAGRAPLWTLHLPGAA